jgi:hypothetical protein
LISHIFYPLLATPKDGAVRAAPLAKEFERNAHFVPRAKAFPLIMLACLARAAARPGSID